MTRCLPKYGFIVSNDLDEAVTIAAVLTTNPLPKGDRVAVLTVSGGAGIWGADTVVAAGPAGAGTVRQSIQAEIKKLLPSYGAAGNPIDVTAQGVHSGGLQNSIDLLSVSDEVDAILVVLSLSSDTRMPFKQAELKPVISAQHKPIVFYSYTLPSAFARSELAASGAVVLSGLTHAGVAMRRMVERARFKLAPPGRRGGVAAPRSLRAPEIRDAVGIRQQVAAARGRHRGAGRSAGDARRAGSMPRSPNWAFRWWQKSSRATSRTRAKSAACASASRPRARCFWPIEALLNNARRHRPDAEIQGVLVGPMAKKGVEIIVGTLLDATFGPMIMVGLGGITTELFRDVVYRPAPVSAAEASAMLAELKAAPLLNGFRGAAKADVAALSQLIAQVSVLAAQHASEISEIEINPVLVHPEGQGVTIVDALVVRKK